MSEIIDFGSTFTGVCLAVIRIALVSNEQDARIVKRCFLLSQIIGVGLELFKTAEEFESRARDDEYPLVIVDETGEKENKDTSGKVQVIKYRSPDALVMVLLYSKIDSDMTEFIKRSGAESVLMEDEFIDTCKPEFLAAQKIHGQYIPIKSSEIFSGKALDMNVYHLMPLNRKLMKVMSKDDKPDEAKLKKFHSVGEFYIKREDYPYFQKYIEKNQDKSAKGLASRCRAKYIYLSITYKNLVRILIDQSHTASFKEGKELSDLCYTLAGDLIGSISAVGSAWEVVDNAGFDEMTAIDRTPAIASIAGLFSLVSGMGKPEEVMVACLLADIGLLEISAEGLQKLRSGGLDSMSDEDKKRYHNHPLASINQIMSRKISLTPEMKEIISCTHERVDQKGFPNQPIARRIPFESMLIQFSEKLDQKSKIIFGKQRSDPDVVKKEVHRSEVLQGGCFSFEFLDKMKSLCS